MNTTKKKYEFDKGHTRDLYPVGSTVTWRGYLGNTEKGVITGYSPWKYGYLNIDVTVAGAYPGAPTRFKTLSPKWILSISPPLQR